MATKKTLEELIASEREHRTENGAFGIIECKKSIAWWLEYGDKTLYQLLEEYVERANNDIFFNKRMVLACWEMINEH